MRRHGAFAAAVRIAGLALLVAGSVGPLRSAEPEAKWIPLFNGKDLSGWTPKIKGHEAGVNFADTFRVQDGVLKVGYEGYPKFEGRFGHLFHKDSFSHYRLRAEYRFVGAQVPGGPPWAIRNSGLMIHGEPPAAMDKDQNFPTSIEVQLLGGGGTGERPTANLCTPGTHVTMDGALLTRHCTNSKSKTYHGEQWVTVEIEVRGSGTIRHFVEGQLVLEYSAPQYDESDAHAKALAQKNGGVSISGGTISIQSESHPIEFRKIELLPLDPNAK